MSYYQIIIYMGRRSLLRNVHRHLNKQHRTTNGESDNSPPTERDSPSSTESQTTALMRDCVSSAFKIIELINYMWINDRLARFSFTDLNCCSTAAIIIMTSEIIQKHPMYRASIETATQAMAHMATGCQNAKQGYKLIQHLKGVMSALQNRDTRQSYDTETEDPLRDEYREWKEWLGLKEGSGASTSPLTHTPPARGPTFHVPPADLEVVSGSVEGSQLDGGSRDTTFNLYQQQDQNTELPDTFYMWPENLDSLGLNGFEDFEFPISYKV